MASVSPASRPTRVRYRVLGMTVAVYMITYMDRVVISNAAPPFESELGISLVAMGWILASFRLELRSVSNTRRLAG